MQLKDFMSEVCIPEFIMLSGMELRILDAFVESGL